jgi:hypothetical protein
MHECVVQVNGHVMAIFFIFFCLGGRPLKLFLATPGNPLCSK